MKQYKAEQTVRLFNPLSSDLNGMRQTLLPGGLECISHNLNRKNYDLKLFEFGNCYFFKGTHYRENPADNYSEEEHLGLFLTGEREVPNWNTPASPTGFYLLKSFAENILRRLGFVPERLIVTETASELFAYGLTLESGKVPLVDYGLVAADLLKKHDLEVPVFYADFRWNNLLQEQKKNGIRYRELPKYPEVRRDLALVLDKGVRFASLKETAFKTEKQLLREVSLFDVYEGKGIPEGKKSYAVSFILRDDNKTLNEKLIDKTMEKLLLAFEKEQGAKLRG
jgi:phenylalanyl-tRNA synthetase beta chain